VRLVDVVYFVLVGGVAIFAALLVLYVAGDWVLLGLALLFLLGLAWASKNAIPQFFEQIRLLLNLGTVREQERVVYYGLPWRVTRLSIYSVLRNEELTGGLVRLPLKELMGLHSRPCSRNEIWFPCRPNEWVLLSDGRRGRVTLQTPEMVQLQLLGGSLVTYPTIDFLALSPENLSKDFRLSVTFGVDYAHQAISTNQVPKIMRERLEKGLAALVGRDSISHLNVEFKEAGPSSLDLQVLADFEGEVAASYEMLQRAIQRILVDTCTEQGWVIPFTQLTLHGAEALAAAE